MAISYDDFLKTIKSGMLDAGGKFNAPSAGINYQAEGMTPEQFYAQNGDMHEDPMARDGYIGTGPQQGDLSLGWKEGAQKTGASGEFFGSLAALLGGQALMGGFGGAGTGTGFGATTAPVTGGTLGITGTALPSMGSMAGMGEVGAGAAGLGAAAAGSVPMTLAEQYGAYGAGGGGVTGGLSTGTVGGFTGAAGGDLVGQAAGGGLTSTLKDAGSWLTSKDSLGGLMSPLKGLSSLYDLYASNQKSNALSDRYNQVNGSINGYGAPGSPEYEAMKQELARKDAASGRNSQYGPRAVDLAARMAQPKLNAQVALNGGQNQLLTQQQNQQYGGLNSLFANLGQTQGNNSIADSLEAWMKQRQQQTGT